MEPIYIGQVAVVVLVAHKILVVLGEVVTVASVAVVVEGCLITDQEMLDRVVDLP
jgi:hypothetical protein